MATRIKPVKKELYEEDFYAWTKAQTDLLRAGRFADLDLEHLIEEFDDLGESLKRSVRSRIRTIIEHLLKLEHSPAREPRGGWYDTITQRSDLLDELTASIRREVGSALPDLYDRARQNAATSLRKHGENAAAALPGKCPYTLDQITGDWLPWGPRLPTVARWRGYRFSSLALLESTEGTTARTIVGIKRGRRVRHRPRGLASGPARRLPRALHPSALAQGPRAARPRARGQHGLVPGGDLFNVTLGQDPCASSASAASSWESCPAA